MNNDRIFYGLEGHRVVVLQSLDEWCRRMEFALPSVAFAELPDGTCVSTIFVGLDDGLNEGPPLVFRTVFNRSGTILLHRRYSTWDEAQAGHDAALREFLAVKSKSEDSGR